MRYSFLSALRRPFLELDQELSLSFSSFLISLKSRNEKEKFLLLNFQLLWMWPGLKDGNPETLRNTRKHSKTRKQSKTRKRSKTRKHLFNLCADLNFLVFSYYLLGGDRVVLTLMETMMLLTPKPDWRKPPPKVLALFITNYCYCKYFWFLVPL